MKNVDIQCAITHSGCQKNVRYSNVFFLQPLMPHFRISEHYYEKRYKNRVFSLRAILLAGVEIL